MEVVSSRWAWSGGGEESRGGQGVGVEEWIPSVLRTVEGKSETHTHTHTYIHTYIHTHERSKGKQRQASGCACVARVDYYRELVVALGSG